MKTKTFSLLAALALFIALPVLAQSPQGSDQPTAQAPMDESAAVGAPVENVEVTEASPDLEATEASPSDLESSQTELGADLETAADVNTDVEGESELPRTASPLALLALLGLGAGGSAFGLRRATRR